MKGTSDIHARIRGFILREFPHANAGSLRDDASMIEAGIIDSIGVLDVVSYLESEFEIHISDEDLIADDFDSINALARLVESQLTSASKRSA